ncbi:MAG: putative bifunctional SAT/APS kinase [Chlamydiia bacterium]|nr:putative bifunctional SAT/APS kinase [Chlamydiia bacterium]MCH9616594.1 putative bifunctional SAT/APS kinase [Chlamydiia bacterium]MCH9629324.1 putative bifunctional SAT/APS kinase [Chlamydiia bacterium]
MKKKTSLRVLFIVLFNVCGVLFADVSVDASSLVLSKRQTNDLELILCGAFAPLEGFLGKADYDEVVQNCRLSSGDVWPMPIMLDVEEAFAKDLTLGEEIVLRDITGTILATLEVSDVWQPDKMLEAKQVYATESTDHPGVAYLMEQTKPFYVGGKLKEVSAPSHANFTDLRKTPAEMKAYFEENGISKVVAFQTRNPMHRAHVEITTRAASQLGAHLLINPIVGQTKPGDIDPYTRVRCYREVLKHYGNGATLSVLPLSMRMAGPREALWHALIRKNYGCTHFIVGRDHAGPGSDKEGNPFYGPYEAQDMLARYSDEIGIEMVPFQMVVYVKNEDRYIPMNEVQPHHEIEMISGTELRRRLSSGETIPEWFSYPSIIEELRRSYPPPHKKGLTIFFTGLSCSGKSTLGNALEARLHETDQRSITLLDGDIVRTNLSKGLGFTKEDRSTNVRRVGFVASEIGRAGGITICCLIAPYERDRTFNQSCIQKAGGNYVEIHVATPLEVCEARDTKGLYAKARLGLIKGFTGIDDPYEIPSHPALTVTTFGASVDCKINEIMDYLAREGYIQL